MFDSQAIEAADEEGVDEYGFGAAVLDFYRKEVSKAHDSRMNHYDQSLHADTKLKIDPTFRGGDRVSNAHILKAIMFRAKFQRSCLGLVLFLYEHGLITLAGLQEPMYVNNPPNPEIGSVFCALATFEIFSRSMYFPFETYTEIFGYYNVLAWLATVVVRGAVVRDMWYLMERIRQYGDGELGDIDIDELKSSWPKGKLIEVDPRAGVAPAWEEEGYWPAFCFWLPHSMGTITDLQQVYKYFDEEYFLPFEKLFYSYFRLNLPVSQPLAGKKRNRINRSRRR